MTQHEIADSIGFSQSAVHYILNGDRTPSSKTAIKLERSTGICREAWMWPERHWNPYIPFSKSSICGSCTNKIQRIKKTVKVCLEQFRKAENKRKAFQETVRTIGTINGHKEGQLILFREIHKNRLTLLASGGMHTVYNTLEGQRWQGLIDAVQKRETVAIPHWPHDIPKGDPASLHLYIQDPRSYYRFSSGRHVLMFYMASRHTLTFDRNVTDELQKFICELDDIWHESDFVH